MPSRLVNLSKSLTWLDFGTPRKLVAPKPDEPARAAFTDTKIASYDWASENIPGSKPPLIRLRDNVTITIVFRRTTSWVASWVFQRPQQFQDDLLAHEQVHYDITALMARDLFVDLMALKSKSYASGQAMTQDVEEVQEKYADIQTIENRYDEETNHGLRVDPQRRWSGFIQTAFTQTRQPPELGPDGTPYKIRLLDVLRSKQIPI